MVEITTNREPYTSTINSKKHHIILMYYRAYIKKRVGSSGQTDHPHIYMYVCVSTQRRLRESFSLQDHDPLVKTLPFDRGLNSRPS